MINCVGWWPNLFIDLTRGNPTEKIILLVEKIHDVTAHAYITDREFSFLTIMASITELLRLLNIPSEDTDRLHDLITDFVTDDDNGHSSDDDDDTEQPLDYDSGDGNDSGDADDTEQPLDYDSGDGNDSGDDDDMEQPLNYDSGDGNDSGDDDDTEQPLNYDSGDGNDSGDDDDTEQPLDYNSGDRNDSGNDDDTEQPSITTLVMEPILAMMMTRNSPSITTLVMEPILAMKVTTMTPMMTRRWQTKTKMDTTWPRNTTKSNNSGTFVAAFWQILCVQFKWVCNCDYHFTIDI